MTPPLPDPQSTFDREWMNRGACRDHPELNWFPAQHQAQHHKTREALAVCHTCPVEKECLAHALATEPRTQDAGGILGGMTPKMRQRLRQAMANDGTLLVARVCANPACRRTFLVRSMHTPHRGVCCSKPSRMARRNLRSRAAKLNREIGL